VQLDYLFESERMPNCNLAHSSPHYFRVNFDTILHLVLEMHRQFHTILNHINQLKHYNPLFDEVDVIRCITLLINKLPRLVNDFSALVLESNNFVSIPTFKNVHLLEYRLVLSHLEVIIVLKVL